MFIIGGHRGRNCIRECIGTVNVSNRHTADSCDNFGLLMVGLKETENDDFIALSGAMKKWKEWIFTFLSQGTFLIMNRKFLISLHFFTFFTLFIFSAAPRWTSPEHINFWSKKKSEKSERSERSENVFIIFIIIIVFWLGRTFHGISRLLSAGQSWARFPWIFTFHYWKPWF